MTALELLPGTLGGSPLARAAIAASPAAAAFYRPQPASSEGWAHEVEEVSARFAAGDWLDRLGPAIAAGGAAAARLARVAEGGGVLVTTGQQPGLFGGPAYTWIKAMSALALADELEALTGRPTAALFWAATDDTDFAEGAATWVAGPAGAERLTLAAAAGSEGAMLAHVPLGDMSPLLDRLTAAAGSAVDADVLRIASVAYTEGATVGDAYVGLLRALLEPLAVAVLDAAHPAARAAMDSTMREALRRSDEVDGALRRRAELLSDAGFDPQVAQVDGLSLVFEDGPAGKARVPIARAADHADTAPAGSLGPNVLLRPIAERAMLPTVAYVGGAGEIAYVAQSGAVADALGVSAPLILPRFSATIIEPHVRRLLDRYGHAPEDFAHPHAPERRAARSALSDEVREHLGELRAGLSIGLARLREATARERDAAAGPHHPVPPDAVLEGFDRQLEHRLDRLERRYEVAAGRASTDVVRDLAAMRGALAPGGVKQERALNLVPLLARHGRALLPMIRDAALPHARRCLGSTSTEAPPWAAPSGMLEPR